MNSQESRILRTVAAGGFANQRQLAERSGLSLGVTNQALRQLAGMGLISREAGLTDLGKAEIEARRPRNAIILAAGFGMRMVPINLVSPKGLLEVRGEPLAERQIRQLKEAGVEDITLVVGFMKERFEYLIDRYGVKLLVNPEYAEKNNLVSLALAAGRISNTYIIPSDIWCAENPFSPLDISPWYMVSDEMTAESDVRINRKNELVSVSRSTPGNRMIGIAYVNGAEAERLRQSLEKFSADPRHAGEFWESTVLDGDRMILPARLVSRESVVEINTYEQLRDLDGESGHLKSEALDVIGRVFGVPAEEVSGITVLKKGMTNRSFLFTAKGKQYIMRIPGEGTDRLINRRQEAEVFRILSGKGLCDDPVYLNPENGYKITAYLPGVRVCGSDSEDDLRRCMALLRQFHGMKLQVGHTFDLFGQIEFYESLWQGAPSAYRDYSETKANVLALREILEKEPKDWCLTHIDAVPDNFLFYRDETGQERLQLTDWEYAGMQDPLVDLAMFSIYSGYDKAQADHLADLYFGEPPAPRIRARIYAYMAVAGLLWSNWCEYKRSLGVDFGEYSLLQYRYAKEFRKHAVALFTQESPPVSRVRQAVILAAGTGTRMRPLTLSTPKPLIRVNGTRMIDTVIRGLRENGITEIYVVVGWLKEQFASLPEEYPGLRLIENPWYDTCNNISSLYCAREHLENAIILDGDQVIRNPAVLSPEFTRSGYNAVWCEGETKEWLMQAEGGRVTGCSRSGGKHGWQLYSVSRWTAEDGRKLRRHLEEEFERKRNRQIYWDDVPMFCHFPEYELGIREMAPGDVTEIDSPEDLAAAEAAEAAEAPKKA